MAEYLGFIIIISYLPLRSRAAFPPAGAGTWRSDWSSYPGGGREQFG